MANGINGKTDGQLLSFSVTFKNGITPDPESLGLDSGEVASYALVQTAYATKLAIAEDPTTRTKVTTEEKRVARAALESSLKFLINRIEGTPSVTDAQKIGLGIHIRKPAEPIQAPTVAPVTVVEYVNSRTVGLKFMGTEEDGRRPEGCESVVVYSYIGDEPVPDDLMKWANQGSTTSLKAEIVFGLNVPAFTKVWLTAAWLSPRHVAGPACTPIYTNLGAGLSSEVG